MVSNVITADVSAWSPKTDESQGNFIDSDKQDMYDYISIYIHPQWAIKTAN